MVTFDKAQISLCGHFIADIDEVSDGSPSRPLTKTRKTIGEQRQITLMLPTQSRID